MANEFIPAPATPGGEVDQQQLDALTQPQVVPVQPQAVPVQPQVPIEPQVPIQQVPVAPVPEVPVEQEALTEMERKVQAGVVPEEEEIAEEIKPIRQQMAKEEAVFRSEQEQINKAYDRRENALKEYQESLENAKKINPKRFFKNQSTGDKITSAIGLFLMGVGGNAQAGLNMIQNQINNDIAAQKLNKEDTIKTAAVGLKLAENELDRLGRLTKNKDRLLKISDMKTKLQLAQTQEMKKFLDQKKLQDMRRDASQGKLIDTSKLSKEESKKYVPGYGFAKDAETAKKAAITIEAADTSNAAVAKIRELLETHGTREVMDRGAVASEESTRRNLQLQLKELFNLGVLNGPDLDLLNEFTGEDFFALTTTDAAKFAKLQGVEEFVKNRTTAALKRAGLETPVMRGDQRVNVSSADKLNNSQVEKLMQKNPGLKRESIIKAMKKNKLWAE